LYKFSVDVWLPLLRMIYSIISSEYSVIIIGSQVLYLTLKVSVDTKNIDLLIEDYNPVKIADKIFDILKLEEIRYEVFRTRDGNLVTHIYIPVSRGVISLEIMSRTHLGKISFTPLAEEITSVNIEDVIYMTLTPEAYAFLQATRPGGYRDIDVKRFKRIREKINWDRVIRLAESYGLLNQVVKFMREIGV